MKGVCIWNNIAVRTEARHSAEMCTQLLFGEIYFVLEETVDWLKISTSDCNYEGWISRKQHTLYDNETDKPTFLVRNTFLYIHNTLTHIAFPVFIGSQIPIPENGKFTLGGHLFSVDLPDPIPIQRHQGLTIEQDSLLDFVFHYLDAPYLWGGRTPAGIDCSGLVQMVFRSLNINLPRDASQQVNCGENVDFFEESQIGDIAFFENNEGNIVHTGIICGYHQIIHASGHVQINTLDETGIYDQYLKKYTHKLRLIRRVLP